MNTQNDVMQLLIGKDVGAGTPTSAKGTIIVEALDTYLVDGEMCVTNAHNAVLSATSVLTDDLVKEYGIKLILRNGTELVHSDLIKQDNILKYTGKTDAAVAEQVTYIGYNSSSGSIEANNNKLYVVRITFVEEGFTGFGQEIILDVPYKSDSSATQLEVALGLVQQLSRTLRRQAVQPIKPELVCDVAYAATATFAHTTTIVKGSDLITVATNLKYDTSTDLAVGDYIRISDTPAVTGSAVTDPIYKVTELVSSTVARVDRPVESASGSYTAALIGVTVLTAAKMATANLGIKLTGIARTFTVGKFPYSKVAFTVGLDSSSSFGDTAVTYNTAMSLGSGTYEQIAELEWNLLGNRMDEGRGDFMWTAPTALATSGKTYDQIAIVYYGDHPTGGVGATPRRQKQLLIAFETGFSTTEGPDNVVDILDAYSTQTSGIGV